MNEKEREKNNIYMTGVVSRAIIKMLLLRLKLYYQKDH
jgi:hypothetical protein